MSRREFITLLGGAAGAWPLAGRAQQPTMPVVGFLKLGLVASLARPGGNLTGINFFGAELTAKGLELLRELVPGAVLVAVINSAGSGDAEATLRDVEPAAHSPFLNSRRAQLVNLASRHALPASFSNHDICANSPVTTLWPLPITRLQAGFC